MPIQMNAGQQFSGLIAVIYDSKGSPAVSIAWGDGPPGALSTVSVSSIGPNEYEVTGSHTYTKPGSYTYSVTYHDGA